jgi:hypothetical protein
MPCLVGLGLAFLVNIFWQHLLELLQGDNLAQLNYEEFMNKARFYMVKFHQHVKGILVEFLMVVTSLTSP